MKIKDIFKDIFKGLRIEVDENFKEPIEAILIDTKNVENCQINYNIFNFQKIKMNIKDKYFIKPGDIIVATIPSEKTCHVGYEPKIDIDKQELYHRKAIVKKNFIVLRNINPMYEPEFIAEYLELIGINNFFSKNKVKNNVKEALTIEDIEGIEIPNIPIEKQQELLKLISPINERGRLYNYLIQNDNEIKKHMISELICNEK